MTSVTLQTHAPSSYVNSCPNPTKMQDSTDNGGRERGVFWAVVGSGLEDRDRVVIMVGELKEKEIEFQP